MEEPTERSLESSSSGEEHVNYKDRILVDGENQRKSMQNYGDRKHKDSKRGNDSEAKREYQYKPENKRIFFNTTVLCRLADKNSSVL